MGAVSKDLLVGWLAARELAVRCLCRRRQPQLCWLLRLRHLAVLCCRTPHFCCCTPVCCCCCWLASCLLCWVLLQGWPLRKVHSQPLLVALVRRLLPILAAASLCRLCCCSCRGGRAGAGAFRWGRPACPGGGSSRGHGRGGRDAGQAHAAAAAGPRAQGSGVAILGNDVEVCRQGRVGGARRGRRGIQERQANRVSSRR